MLEKPLVGKTIVITRAKEQSKELAEKLQSLGATVFVFPTIKIVPPASHEELDRALAELEVFEWLVFTSVNAVEYFLKGLAGQGTKITDIKTKKIAAVGSATAKALEERGLKVSLVPKKFKAEDVIDEFAKLDVRGTKILIPRAKTARELLPDALRRMGAEVVVAPVYETVPDETKREAFLELLEEGKVDAITFTSGSTFKFFLRLVESRIVRKDLLKLVFAAIGPVTASEIAAAGFRVEVTAEKSTSEGLAEAIAGYFNPKTGVNR